MRRRIFLMTAGGPLMAARTQATPVAETRQGKIRGAEAEGVAVFRGIRYGQATRFQAPSKPASWTGVHDATETGARCVQGPGNIFLSPVIGEYFGGGRADRVALARQSDSEDCLNLNVLTPGLRGKRPVMVYIHGGGFTGGSNMLTLFASRFPREQDVVLVGVNHRINVFGYLHLGSKFPDAGNAGQLDLIAALEWVRDNIERFGGDPRNVTIFGESGGGAKIGALMAMPAAKGLFHKAIVESGSSLKVATADEAGANARAVVEAIGLDEIAGVPAEKLFAAAKGFRASPVVDGRSIPAQTWEPEAPRLSAHIPMIVGTCKDEGTLFALQDTEAFRLDEAGLRARLEKAGIGGAEKLIALYRRDFPRESATDIYFRISSDRGARHSAIQQAERQLARGQAPVHMYYFTWNTPLAEGRIRAFHTAELPLAMRLVRFPESEGLSKNIAKAWADFARTGNPGWPAYSLASRATMIFDAESKVVNDPEGEQLRLLRAYPSGRL